MVMASSTRARQPRLRASCDGCFLAKVKCSKARPVCSRCLACGIDCRYSPSSRAGKAKSPSLGALYTNMANMGYNGVEMQQLQHGEEVGNGNGMVYTISPPSDQIFTGWTTPPISVDGSMSRHASVVSTGLGFGASEERAMCGDGGAGSLRPDMYTTMPWTPPNDLSLYGSISAMRSQSLDISAMSGRAMGWPEHSQDMMAAYSQVSPSASIFFPSPAAAAPPSLQTTRSGHRSPGLSGGSCTCFTVCLQSLQHLHNASEPASPSLDVVLSVNRKAVAGCAAMLACARCMSRSGSHTAVMLLATVTGKIASSYKNATQSYFENNINNSNNINDNSNNSVAPTQSGAGAGAGNELGLNFGAYQFKAEDGRWLELEILAREVQNLQELYARFCDVCCGLSDDADVSKAMMAYLGQTLSSTMDLIGHRRGELSAYA